MSEKTSHKCCACNKRKVKLKGHLERRHNLFYQFLAEKLSNKKKWNNALLQKYYTLFRRRVRIAVDYVIRSIRDVEANEIVQNDKILKKYIKSRLPVSAVIERDKTGNRKSIRGEVSLMVKVMKIAWENLDNNDFQDLTISTLMIPAHTQVIKDSFMQFSTQHSGTYPRRVITVLRKCASLVSTESEFFITCMEIVEFQRAENFLKRRQRSSLVNFGSDDEELGSPEKSKRRRVYTSWNEESNVSFSDDEELGNDNFIKESFDENGVQPPSNDDEQVVSNSQGSILSIHSLNNFSLMLSRVDEPRSDYFHDFLRAKQRLEEAEVIAEPLTAESDQESNEFVNDSPTGQSRSSSSDLLMEEIMKILEGENQQHSKPLEDSCEELEATLDTLKIRLDNVKSRLTNIEFPPEFNFKDYKAETAQLVNELGEQQFNLEMLIRKGKNLVDKENITDSAPIRAKIEALETQLKELNDALDEKSSKSTSGQFTAYDVLLEEDRVLDWLTKAEERAASLHSVDALDLKELKMKNEELKVIQKECKDYKEIIDRIEEFVMIHDGLLKEHSESLTKGQAGLNDVDLEESAPMVQFSGIRQRYEQLLVELSYRQSELRVVDASILKEFLDGYSSLNSWLGTMERFMKIVDLQSEQIHVLQEEFRYKKPEFDHWVKFGQEVRSIDSVRIDIKVKDIHQRWQHQVNHLDDQAEGLKNALNTRNYFDSNVHHLRETLKKIAVDFDELSLDEQLEGQLIKIDDLRSKLEDQRSLLGDTACTQLRKALSEVKISMQGKLTVIEELFKALQENFQHRKAKIEEILHERRQFETSCSEILDWLASELQNIPEKLLISADQAVIQQQLDQYKKIHDGVEMKETQVMELMDKGRDIMTKASKTDNEAMKEDLDKIQTKLNRLKKETLDRRIKLETCAEHCQRYYRHFSSSSSSVQRTEVKLQNLMALNSITASVSGTGVDEHIQALNSFAVDVLKHAKAFKDLRLLRETFLNSCDIDADGVTNELEDLENRWQTLFDELNEYIVFNEYLSHLRTRLLPYENRFTFYSIIGDSAKDGIRKLREEIKALEKDLQIVKGLAKKLASLPEAIYLQVIDVSDRICNLGGKLDNLISGTVG